MFCVKFPVGPSGMQGRGRQDAESHRSPPLARISRNRARPPPRNRLSCEGDSEDSTVLDETDAPRRIIATLTRLGPLTMHARFPPPRAAHPPLPRPQALPPPPVSSGIIEYRSFPPFCLPFFLSFFLLLFRARKLTALSSRSPITTRSRRGKLCNDRSRGLLSL